MLRNCARLLLRGTALSVRPQAVHSVRCSFPGITRTFAEEQPRDYGFPNATWNSNMMGLYQTYLAQCNGGGWRKIPSYNTTVHHIAGDPLDPARETRLFTRNLDQDGDGFEYCMFYNKAERRMVCLFQPGPYLEGPPGYTHGGCIATIIDSTAGAGAVYLCGSVMTANLNINYKNPIRLGSTVIVDSKVEKIENRKVYTTCHIRSHDDTVLHTESTVLFIKLNV
ncbi:hypothetical protein GDO86_019154 [Hymenochirus boettgeri]|uniref:Acyl-coenzyme A thioesterase THEM4 n=1 Tax=Hymenochirus boettgeri TaxID=247094 RepID=A0A8T2IE64_9PIPI|nr:hypothetical protein GDO86_019154 [Hymenochirus boettgeri]